MEPLSISLIGFSLFQLTAEALVGVAPDLATGVLGNFAHELTKLSFASVAERVSRGELPPNHDLQRAARRAFLNATLMATRHYRHSQSLPDGKPEWRDWADALAGYLSEEIAATRGSDYQPPASQADGRYSDLVSRVEAATDPGAALQEALRHEALVQLRHWHTNVWAPKHPGFRDPSAVFEGWLKEGWPYVEIPPSPIGRVILFFTRRRGRAARYHRTTYGLAAAAAAPRGKIHWFDAYCAFFTEELKTNNRAHAIFDARLLTEINAKLKQVSPQSVPLSVEQLGGALTGELERWGRQFCTRLDDLGREVAAGNAAVLEKLAVAQDAATRDRVLLDSMQVHVVETRLGVNRVEATLERIEAAYFERVDRRIPRQLPDRATVGELLGRATELADLRGRLERGENAAVVGPAGLGKTALAAAAVRAVVGETDATLAVSPFPDGVVLLDLYQLKARADDVFGALARALIGRQWPLLPARERAVEACRNRRVLVIFEGAEEADGRDGRSDLGELLDVLAPENRRLILTRELMQASPAETVTVGEALAPTDAAELLHRLTKGGLTGAVAQPVLTLLEGHPLALTWAGGLLVRGDEDPAVLAGEWTQAGLPRLNDPEPKRRHHTLHWLYARSVRALTEPERILLEAAGLLAHAPVPLVMAETVWPRVGNLAPVGGEGGARSALRRLVQAGLLRRSSTEADHWQFTHVLAYRFARREHGSPAELRELLGHWLREQLGTALKGNAGGVAARSLSRPLLHIAALLRTDEDQRLWGPLANFTLYDAVERLTALGRLELVLLTLHAVGDWLNGFPPDKATESQWQREYSTWFGALGDVAAAQGDLAGAMRSFTKSKSIIERLAESDTGNAGWQRDLSVSTEKLGEVAVAQGDLPGAMRSFTKSRTLREGLAASESGNAGWQRDLFVSHIKVGEVAVAQGDLAGAMRSFTDGKSIAERLAASEPGNAGWQRDLFVSHNRVGEVAVAQGNLVGALCSFTDGKTIAERLAASDPSNAEWQRDLSVSLEKLGNVAVAEGDLPRATRSFTESKAIRERLAASNSAHAEWQRDLSVSLEKLGEVAVAQGDLPGALRFFMEGKSIHERFAASNPAHAEWQRDLSVSLEKLGNVAVAQGDLSGAIRSFTDSKTIAERLAASDPSNAEWQRDLWVSYWRLADLCGKSQQGTDALVWWQKAHDTLADLKRRGSLRPGDDRFLAAIQAKLAYQPRGESGGVLKPGG